jgi:signal transduction histidine kinase
MGDRLQARGGDERRVVLRLAGSYLAVFLLVIAALSLLAFALIQAEYRSALGPALTLPEGAAALAAALRTVALAILAVDAALALVVGAASYALARSAVRPLIDARAREARFAADAAHELRTPLGVIASVAQAARDEGEERQRAALDTVAREALDASDLIADLLTLARSPESFALAREPVDVAALAGRAVRDAQPRAQARDIVLALDASSAIVDGDERRLLQLLRNLIDNALRYAHARIDVTVRTEGRDAVLTVADDGPGVAPEIRATVFERFAKEPSSDGSGLGLAICRWVAHSHGGDIALASASALCVRLPLGEYPAVE